MKNRVPQPQPTPVPKLPAPYRKAWKISNHIAFNWRERLRILFLGQVQFETLIMSERMPGQIKGEIANVRVERLVLGKTEALDYNESRPFKGMTEHAMKDDLNKLRSIPGALAKKAQGN